MKILDRKSLKAVKLPFILEIELIDFYIACNFKPASHKWHNTGQDGLFLHSVAVAHLATQSKGFQFLDESDQKFLVRLAMYHDFETKVMRHSDNEKANIRCNRIGEQYLVPMLQEWLEDNNSYDDWKDLYTLWQFHHHGLIDGIELLDFHTNKVTCRFKFFLMEVARLDSADANFSTAEHGLSTLALVSTKL